ncbi:hypothetical protein LFYK43_06300 [Ligilactobacillus salitolerans]|uniref:Uncharacterized protein n=1 Tax=Ligilactobacillus salitolerans TaxID=1808352 RepID=A0A401IRM3_9LACO|nr:hypothetical protein [Ligilactobacillus salitolerans]GBG94171.1 hypothetical protein LFYK43_06300 [Ligilactobacillus salitolerans]
MENELRLLLLEQYGFKKAVQRPDISNKDLELIKQAAQDPALLEQIEAIQAKRQHEEILSALKTYQNLKHPNCWAAAMGKHAAQSTLEGAWLTASAADKEKIEQILEV